MTDQFHRNGHFLNIAGRLITPADYNQQLLWYLKGKKIPKKEDTYKHVTYDKWSGEVTFLYLETLL